jgi:uncharacterized protein with ATP-grasp and redox domains
MSEKKCEKCDEIKPLDLFYAQKSGLHGRRALCKVCFSERQTAWVKERKNDDDYRVQYNKKSLEWMKKKYRENPDYRASRAEYAKQYYLRRVGKIAND